MNYFKFTAGINSVVADTGWWSRGNEICMGDTCLCPKQNVGEARKCILSLS